MSKRTLTLDHSDLDHLDTDELIIELHNRHDRVIASMDLVKAKFSASDPLLTNERLANVLHYARKNLNARDIHVLTDLPKPTVTALLHQMATAGIDIASCPALTQEATEPKTCGTCEHREDDGDCVALAGIDLPMWLRRETSIEPVDADVSADECDAWSPRDEACHPATTR